MRYLLTMCLSLVLVGALFADPSEVVVYNSYANYTYPNDALDNLGWPYTAYDADNESDFRNDVADGADIVIFNCPSWYETASLDTLETYCAGGGILIMSFWALPYESDHGLFIEMEVDFQSSYTTPIDVYFWDDGHQIFNNPNTLTEPLTFTEVGWTSDGQRVWTTEADDSGVIAGYTTDNTTGEGALVLNLSETTIYNAFCFDEGGTTMVDLIENELVYLWSVHTNIQPTSLGQIKSLFE